MAHYATLWLYVYTWSSDRDREMQQLAKTKQRRDAAGPHLIFYWHFLILRKEKEKLRNEKALSKHVLVSIAEYKHNCFVATKTPQGNLNFLWPFASGPGLSAKSHLMVMALQQIPCGAGDTNIETTAAGVRNMWLLNCAGIPAGLMQHPLWMTAFVMRANDSQPY